VKQQLNDFAILAKDRSDVLSLCAMAAPPEYVPKLKDAAKHFSDAAEILAERASWRGAGRVNSVAGALSQLTRRRYWQMGPGIVGWRGFVRDLIDAVTGG
jgi:hypothetical protein